MKRLTDPEIPGRGAVQRTACLLLHLLFAGIVAGAGCSPDPTELFAATYAADAVQLQRLLEEGGDVTSPFGERGVTLLHVAARRNETEVASILLEAGADVDAKSDEGETPLQSAVLANHGEMVDFLVRNGADLSLSGWYGMTALNLAALRGRTEMVDALLAAGADPNVPDARGRTALASVIRRQVPGGDRPEDTAKVLAGAGGFDSRHYSGMEHRTALFHACRLADERKIRHLLQTRLVDPEVVYSNAGHDQVLNEAARHYGLDHGGVRALHWASAKGLVEALGYLVEAGADVDAMDQVGRTSLYYAVATARPETVAALLELGADPDAGGTSVLRSAVTRARGDTKMVEIARLLIRAGADVNYKDDDGDSLVELAAPPDDRMLDLLVVNGAQMTLPAAISAKRTDEAVALIRAGRDLHRTVSCDSLVYTMRDWAIEHEEERVARALADRGIGMRMWSAVYNGNVAEVKRHLHEGVDPNDGDAHSSWLMLAVFGGQVEIARLLLSRGARVNDEDMDGHTALDFALDDDNEPMIRLLQSHGATKGSRRTQR